MSVCTLSERTHQYRLDKKPVLSVTQVLSITGRIVGQEFMTEESRVRGQQVHALMEKFFKTRTFFRPEGHSGYIGALKRFVADTGFRCRWCEKKVFNADRGFCGRIDLVGYLNGRLVLLDVKTGAVPSSLSLQLSGYYCALASMGTLVDACFGLKLTADGKYKLVPFPITEIRAGVILFLALLDNARESDEWKAKLARCMSSTAKSLRKRKPSSRKAVRS